MTLILSVCIYDSPPPAHLLSLTSLSCGQSPPPIWREGERRTYNHLHVGKQFNTQSLTRSASGWQRRILTGNKINDKHHHHHPPPQKQQRQTQRCTSYSSHKVMKTMNGYSCSVLGLFWMDGGWFLPLSETTARFHIAVGDKRDGTELTGIAWQVTPISIKHRTH